LSTFNISHEIFVPREIIYDLWASADHFQVWFPALGNATLHDSQPPEQLQFTLADASELIVEFSDLNGTTRIELSQSSSDSPELPNNEADWHSVFAALENYLSAI